jgi:hypothetical protein
MGGFAAQPRLPPRPRGFARAAYQMAAPHLLAVESKAVVRIEVAVSPRPCLE